LKKSNGELVNGDVWNGYQGYCWFHSLSEFDFLETNMKRVIAGALFVGGILLFLTARGEQPLAMNIPAPEFDRSDKSIEWINSKPLQLKDLRGQVVAVHFWTFG
jgi:hypothetical protein